MRDRVQVTRPERRIINRAAQVAQNRIAGVTSTSGVAALPGRDVTTQGGSGTDIYTIKPMIWGEDNWGDSTVHWSKA